MQTLQQYNKAKLMQNLVQHKEDIAATITTSATGSAWIAWISGLNEILIMVSTLIAILVGAWTLYDKWRAQAEKKRGIPSAAAPAEGSDVEPPHTSVEDK